MIGVPKPLGRVKQSLQELLALDKRCFAKVVPVAVEKVKGEVNGGYLRGQVFAGRAHVHAFLQSFEATVTLRVQGPDLSVKNCLAGGWRSREESPLGVS